MFVELVVGWVNNSLGLISDAGHMFFDNASLFIGLYAAYMGRWKADATFTYGYARYEVLAGFVNGIFLVFVGLSVVFEGVERLWEPPEIHADHVLPVSVAGLAVNVIGLVFFHDAAHGHSHGGGGGGHGHSHGSGGGECSGGHGEGEAQNENMYGVYLHVLADALGSVGVIVSSLLIKYFGWQIADPLASIAISFLILLSVIPLLQTTVGPLLSRVPESLEARFVAAVARTRRLPDVVAVEQAHMWKHHVDTIVASLHVHCHPAADDQKVMRAARKLLAAAGAHVVTVQVTRDGEAAAGQPAGVAHDARDAADDSGDAADHDDSDAHGHSHGGAPCHGHGHSHSHGHAHGAEAGADAGDDHGHAHGAHGHSHGAHGDAVDTCSHDHSDHHSNGEEHHGHSHGHSHDGGHGHSHGGGHGHSHGGGGADHSDSGEDVAVAVR